MIDTASRSDIEALLCSARERTIALTSDLRDDQLAVPLLEIINPLLWELGHIAYFAEYWTLRNLYGWPPILPNADALYDSAKIPHDDRWSLPLPSREGTLRFMAEELHQVLTHLKARTPTTKDVAYFHRLAVHHEDMHGEALVYTRQTLGYPRPQLSYERRPIEGGPLPGDVSISGGTYRIGARSEDGFVFDNEKWEHDVELRHFAIARAPVTNAEFASFVEGGGYRNRRYWSDDGWAWREAASAEQPAYWQRRNGGNGVEAWTRRHFDAHIPLQPHEPVCHVSWHEAQAYCAWSGRRLPTEAEWEVAATGGARRRHPWGEQLPDAKLANVDVMYGDVVDVAAFAAGESPVGCRQMIGNVWEWTATTFEPYPGFLADPYKEYSQPWFGTHMVVRGGAWSTRDRLITTRWRNFYRPQRCDIITGFRTCKA